MMKRIAQWATAALSLILIILACSKDDGPDAPDSNNGTPNIAAQTINASEDMAPGVIDNVSASDPNGDPITFSIKTNADNLFKISEDGELSLAADKELDYESASSHELVIEVTDGTKSASATITVNVGNIRDEPFITTWDVGDGETLEIPTGGDFIYSCTIDWGDGTIETISAATPSHTYESQGTYTVTISVGFPSIEMADNNSADNLISIDQWGEIEWKKLEYAFFNCINMVCNASDTPDLSVATDLKGMFQGASSFTGDLSNWNLSNITDTSSMFSNATSFNADLSKWIMKNVEDMSHMFAETKQFNGDISGWNVSKVDYMDGMFLNADNFNQNLGNWDIQNVDKMIGMLSGSGLTNDNYEKTLIGWVDQENVPSKVTLGANGLERCSEEALDAIDFLVNEKDWAINDDGCNM